MKTNFQQFDARSDEELIEISMASESADAVMARNVLEYRKYLVTKRQADWSFRLAVVVACMGLIQLLIAVVTFWQFIKEAGAGSPAATGPSVLVQVVPSAEPVVLQQDITLSITDAGGTAVRITVPAGTSVTVLAKDTTPAVCSARIHLQLEIQEGVFTITDSIPLSAIGETC